MSSFLSSHNNDIFNDIWTTLKDILIFRKRRQIQSCTRFGYDCTNNADSTDITSDEDEPLADDAKATYVGINIVYVTLNIALCKCNGDNSKQNFSPPST